MVYLKFGEGRLLIGLCIVLPGKRKEEYLVQRLLSLNDLPDLFPIPFCYFRLGIQSTEEEKCRCVERFVMGVGKIEDSS